MWPFRRKADPAPLVVDAQDWRVGHMAECIDGHPWFDAVNVPAPGPNLGDKLMVRSVFVGESCTGQKAVALSFVGMPGARGFHVDNFRKITLTDTGADRTVSKARPRTPAHSGAPQ